MCNIWKIILNNKITTKPSKDTGVVVACQHQKSKQNAHSSSKSNSRHTNRANIVGAVDETALSWQTAKERFSIARQRKNKDKYKSKASRRGGRGHQLSLQSGEDDDSATDHTTPEDVTSQNLRFRDEALSQRIEMGDMNSGAYDVDTDSLADLGQFLSRPVRIHGFTWLENTFTQASILPWHLYFNTPQIKKKLDNFGRISCRLHLKFVLNASPFYFGSLRACYFPLVDARSTYTNINDQVPFSQVPGVYLEPQSMSSAEMVLPFLWPRNWLDATVSTDFERMGVLQFLQFANLRSANNATGVGITIAVYAWAEDVRIMGPTVKLALQSEETSGTISAPATMVANVASRLTDVPVIGPFATATSVGAKAVASIAKLFGYSNPPMIGDVSAMQPKTFHAFANVETRMPIDKLSVDPKNEVTISSKVAGVDEEDPLAFKNLLTHDSFLLGTLWANNLPVDTLIFSALVNPGYLRSGGGYYTSPPMSHFSQGFRLWRGSLVYKFRFIKTKYHKGRVLISWDPCSDISTTADTETTTFSRIVDISVEDEVEVIVPYRATSPWLRPQHTTNNASNGPAPSYTYNDEYHNGSITMRVQSIITAPVLAAEIDVLVYVRAGDDFMLSAPRDITTLYTVRDPAGVIQSGEEDSITQNSPEVDTHVAAITTGEVVCSMRPILHRASLGYAQYAGKPATAAPAGIYQTANYIYRVPYGVGRMGSGYGYATISGAGQRYNFGPNHPLDWTLNCFVGYRGSVNIHVNTSGLGKNVTNVPHMSIARYYANPIVASEVIGNVDQAYSSALTPNGYSRGSIRYPSGERTIFQTGQHGMSLTNTQGQPACSVNIPQYSRYRFYPAFMGVRNVDPHTNARFYDEAVVTCQFNVNDTTTDLSDWPTLAYYYSAGVDFQPIFFLCTPRIFDTTLATAREVFP